MYFLLCQNRIDETDTEEKKSLVFFAHKKYSRSFIKLRSESSRISSKNILICVPKGEQRSYVFGMIWRYQHLCNLLKFPINFILFCLDAYSKSQQKYMLLCIVSINQYSSNNRLKLFPFMNLNGSFYWINLQYSTWILSHTLFLFLVFSDNNNMGVNLESLMLLSRLDACLLFYRVFWVTELSGIIRYTDTSVSHCFDYRLMIKFHLTFTDVTILVYLTSVKYT